MLDTIGAGDPDYKGPDWGDIWQESEENNLVSKEIEDLISKRKDNTDADKHHQDDSEFAMPMKAQLIAVIRRSFVSIWRSPEYIIGMFVLHIVRLFRFLLTVSLMLPSSLVSSTLLLSGISGTARSTCRVDCSPSS